MGHSRTCSPPGTFTNNSGLYLGGAAAPDERWVVLGLARFQVHSQTIRGCTLVGAAAPDERWVVLGLARLQVHSQTIQGCTLVALLLQMKDRWF